MVETLNPSRATTDVETSSEADLRKVGAYKYSTDPSTRINCATIQLNDRTAPFFFDYYHIEDFKNWLLDLLHNTTCKFVMHNALFELAIFQNVLGVVIPPDRVIDTMAKAGYYGYPRSLDEAAKALQCSQLKDLVGAGVMKQLATGKWTPAEKPEDFQTLYKYNINDVAVTVELDQKLPDLPPEVQALYELDVEINMRGIPLDMKVVENAIYLKEQLITINNHRMADLTGNAATAVTQVKQIQQFVIDQGTPMSDLTADTVRRTLDHQIPDVVRQVLELRLEAGLTSLAKYDQMKARQVGGRLFQEFDNYGCISGRPKGRGVQTLNLPRATNADYWAELIAECPELLYGLAEKPPQKIKEATRGAIKASEGHVLLGGDAGQMEARCTGWTANDPKFMELFSGDKDPYCEYGPALWGHTITKADMLKRTACKATVLQMGFAGGIGAFQIGAETYGIDMDVLANFILPTASPQELRDGHWDYHNVYMSPPPDKPFTEAQGTAASIVKQRYRRDFAGIVAYWDLLWDAFLNGGDAGPVTVTRKGSLRILRLPSGRCLYYHNVRQVNGEWLYDARDKVKRIWKGTVMENVAQAENHDITTWWMIQANKWIAPVVHQCYDEFTMEILKQRLEEGKRQLEELTKTQPDWSKGMPLVFEIWSGVRYG